MTARITPESVALLERLRARLRAGDVVSEACTHCGVSDDVGRGMIRRHGREGPAPPAPPAPELPGPRPGCCAWPEGEGRAIRFECRSPPQPGRPYCAFHCSRAFVRPPPRTERLIVFARLGTTL